MPEFFKFCKLLQNHWNFTKMTESVFVEQKTYFGLRRTHLSGLAGSSWFHLYAFEGLCQWQIASFASQDTSSKSFEILHASSNNCLLIRKLSLMELWCTADRFLEFSCGPHILSLPFMCLNFSKFANCYKTAWNFTQMAESVFVEEKT